MEVVSSRQWEPQDLLDDLQEMIGQQFDCYLNKELATLCTARDYLKAYFDLGTVEHLTELVKAESEGRLVVLPCKIGRYVYIIEDGQIHRCIIQNAIVRSGVMARDLFSDRDISFAVHAEDIGVTVFLTNLEAQAALEKMEGKK